MDFGSECQATQYHDAPAWDYDFVPSESRFVASSSDSSSDDEISSQCSSTTSASSASSLPVVRETENAHRTSYSFQNSAHNTTASEASNDTITSCSNTIRPSTRVEATRKSGQRQHPRRTNRLQESPPSLIRQNNRKVNFVDNLVGKSGPQSNARAFIIPKDHLLKFPLVIKTLPLKSWRPFGLSRLFRAGATLLLVVRVFFP